jgi:hypothetical protein
MNIRFCLKCLKGGDHLEDLGVDGADIKRDIIEIGGKLQTGLIGFRTGISNGFL